MPEIQILPSHVADLIAAGEVVERPASAVKELVENAVDAGASKVVVEVSHGGMTFLRVTDDGRGIPADQLPRAFLRHATSKLRTEYDLEAIGTLGFRGEALAAISAVSRMQVMSRTEQAPMGASLALEGGIPGQVEEAGCPLGTTMVVRDLFYNTPARLKFMKKDAAEGAAVFAAVQRLALSHPEVSFQFIRDGKQELLTPGDGKLESAVYAVLGRELALGLRPVQASGEEMSVSGFVSMPACCRNSRNWQFFFVNGRFIKSRLMMAALEEAYANQRMVGKFPACVLHLRTKLNAVDVNVHPAKTEVKFGAERQVFSAVYHAVLSALEADHSRPAAVLDKPVRHDTVTPNQTTLIPPTPAVRPPVVQVHDSTYRPAPKAEPPRYIPPARPEPAPVQRPTVSPAAPPPRQEPVQAPAAPSVTPAPAQAIPEVKAEPVAAAPQIPASAPAPEPEPESIPAAPETAPWRVAGEVLNTYIVVEQGDTVYFIDKHAAHERMNFDRMKAAGYTPMSQTLLVPAVCRLDPREEAALLEQLPLLEEFGFQAEDLNGALMVRQAPDYLDVDEIPGTLSELAGKLLAGGRPDPAAARDELMHTMACKAAIKGGWKTSLPELERVAQAVMSGQVKYCPHGRPVAIELTRKELEKQFKRI